MHWCTARLWNPAALVLGLNFCLDSLTSVNCRRMGMYGYLTDGFFFLFFFFFYCRNQAFPERFSMRSSSQLVSCCIWVWISILSDIKLLCCGLFFCYWELIISAHVSCIHVPALYLNKQLKWNHCFSFLSSVLEPCFHLYALPLYQVCVVDKVQN